MTTPNETNAAPIEVGTTYDLRHTRLGRATVRVVEIIDDEWIETEVVAGVLRGMRDEWHAGDRKTVLRGHCTFYPNPGPV